MNVKFDNQGISLHDLSMEKRMSSLEAIIPTLATKADMAELRAYFEKGQKENRNWMLVTALALVAAMSYFGKRESPQLIQVPVQTPLSAPVPTIIYAVPPPAAPVATQGHQQ